MEAAGDGNEKRGDEADVLLRHDVRVLSRSDGRAVLDGGALRAGARVMVSELPGAADGLPVRVDGEGDGTEGDPGAADAAGGGGLNRGGVDPLVSSEPGRGEPADGRAGGRGHCGGADDHHSHTFLRSPWVPSPSRSPIPAPHRPKWPTPVLVPIEERLQGLEGVRELQGSARPGLGIVTAELTRGADLRAVKDDIEIEVARITTFPAAAETPRIAEREPQELAVQFALHGDVPRETLKALAERAREGLSELPDVSQVSISGVPADLIEIAVDRATLRAYGIGLTELGAQIASETLDLSGGGIDTGDTDIQARTVGEAETADALREKILFSDETGARVRLGDIARVRETLAETDVAATVSGQPAVFVSVNRAGSEQVLAVADATLAYVEDELRPILPPGVEATIWRDEAQTLRGRINLLVKNGLIGTALILLVLTLFLDLRVAAWVAAGVVIAFVGTFAPMLAFGTTINQLSLFGFILALGIVVDDAIVVGENTYAELEGEGDAEGAAERGVLRVWRPILFSVTTTICAFVPLLFLPGSSGSSSRRLRRW